MKKNWLFVALLAAHSSIHAMGVDDPLLVGFQAEKFETRAKDGSDPLVLDAEFWVGRDLEKFVTKIDLEKVAGATEEAELQFLFNKAIDPYWDLRLGWRHNAKPGPARDYLAVGVDGVSPYQIEASATAFAGEGGQISFRLDAEYEYMLTQRVVLRPNFGFNLYSKNDDVAGIGSGLSDLTAGVRLGYEMAREFTPYIGVHWFKKYGHTADLTRDEGGKVSDSQVVAGVRFWF
jgi:copper resistance protein B